MVYSLPPKPIHHARQQGFVLFAALIFLMLVTMLAFSLMKSDLIEQQVSANMSDRASTMQLAESALKAGEAYAAKLSDTAAFSNGCNTSAGLCQTAGSACAVEAWQRSSGGACTTGTDGSFVFDSAGTTCIAYPVNAANGVKNPCYIVEQLQTNYSGGGTLFRITARAWGLNSNTKVTVQSVLQVN